MGKTSEAQLEAVRRYREKLKARGLPASTYKPDYYANMSEEQKEHRRKQVNKNKKRYNEVHNIKRFSVDLESEIIEEINSFLKAHGITQKDFILQSFLKLKEKGDF